MFIKNYFKNLQNFGVFHLNFIYVAEYYFTDLNCHLYVKTKKAHGRVQIQ